MVLEAPSIVDVGKADRRRAGTAASHRYMEHWQVGTILAHERDQTATALSASRSDSVEVHACGARRGRLRHWTRRGLVSRGLGPCRYCGRAPVDGGIHIHDWRHTGNQFTADAGANPKELMARMGHDSPRAALIYLHSSGERQRALADAVGKAARAELAKSMKCKTAKPSGTRLARNHDDHSKN